MRQVNFVVIFVICLALVLFGIQNTTPVPIYIVNGIELQAPLCVELIVSMGIGAVLAWVFSVWVQLQGAVNSGRDRHDLQQRDLKIEELQQDIERYRVELEEQKLMLPASQSDAETSEAFAK